jgi:uncharacterized protein YbaP (TraB family)
MKRVALPVLLVIAMVGCRKPAPAPTDDGHGYLRPLLWKIEKDGKTTYAFGTIHTGVDAEQRLPPAVWAKVDAAPAFAMETDLSDPAIAAMLQCVQCSLHRDLGDADYAKLEQLLGKPVVNRLDGMKPLVAATMLAMRGLPSTPQMDTALLARARAHDARIVYLEPAADQAAMLERQMNLKALHMMIDDPDGTLDSTKKLLAAYVAGDAAAMLAINDEGKRQALAHGYTAAEYDAAQEDMVYRRNAAWITPIEQLHAQGGGFLAVGALHLIGPRSVLDLLSQRGYKITRM